MVTRLYKRLRAYLVDIQTTKPPILRLLRGTGRLHLSIARKTTGHRTCLPLVFASPCRSVGSFCGGHHGLKHDLTDAHARVEFYRTTPQIGEFQGDLSLKTRIDEPSGGVHNNRQATDTTAPFNPRHKIGRDLDSLNGAAQRELARMQHKGLTLCDPDLIGVASHRVRIP